MRTTLSLIAFAVAAAFAVAVSAQQQAAPTGVKNFKFQSTWPASLTLQDNFKMFAERVDKLTGGQVKIEALPAGSIVPPFEILDATHKRVIDGGHGVAYYWVGKNKAATLFSGTPAGPFGMDHFDFLGWMNEGGGMDLYWEFYRDILKLNIVAWPIGGASPQALGWFKRPIKSVADFKGLKCRETGIVAEIYQRMGMQTVNMPGGEIVPSAQRGVIDCAEWVGGIEDLGLDRRGRVGEESVLQESVRLAARICREGGSREALHVPAVLVRRELLFPGEETGGQGEGTIAGRFYSR